LQLTSQSVQTVARVTGNSESADSITELQPYFNYIYIESVSFSAGDTVAFNVQ
jgi:hypothetical protein